MQGIYTKKSEADDLYNIVIAPKSTQKYQEIYRLIVQLAVMAAASSKTEMTPCGHVFPDRVSALDNIQKIVQFYSFYIQNCIYCK